MFSIGPFTSRKWKTKQRQKHRMKNLMIFWTTPLFPSLFTTAKQSIIVSEPAGTDPRIYIYIYWNFPFWWKDRTDVYFSPNPRYCWCCSSLSKNLFRYCYHILYNHQMDISVRVAGFGIRVNGKEKKPNPVRQSWYLAVPHKRVFLFLAKKHVCSYIK